MKNLINQAIIDLKENNVYDIATTGHLLDNYKHLHERISPDVFGVCPTCYEIPTRESYCNCKIKLDASGNEMTRAELLVFINLYEEIDEKANLLQQTIQKVTFNNVDEIKAEFEKAKLLTPSLIQAMNDKAIQSTDNIVPKVIAQNEPVLNISNEYETILSDLQSSGAVISDFNTQSTPTNQKSNLSAEERAVLNREDFYF